MKTPYALMFLPVLVACAPESDHPSSTQPLNFAGLDEPTLDASTLDAPVLDDASEQVPAEPRCSSPPEGCNVVFVDAPPSNGACAATVTHYGFDGSCTSTITHDPDHPNCEGSSAECVVEHECLHANQDAGLLRHCTDRFDPEDIGSAVLIRACLQCLRAVTQNANEPPAYRGECACERALGRPNPVACTLQAEYCRATRDDIETPTIPPLHRAQCLLAGMPTAGSVIDFLGEDRPNLDACPCTEMDAFAGGASACSGFPCPSGHCGGDGSCAIERGEHGVIQGCGCGGYPEGGGPTPPLLCVETEEAR